MEYEQLQRWPSYTLPSQTHHDSVEIPLILFTTQRLRCILTDSNDLILLHGAENNVQNPEMARRRLGLELREYRNAAGLRAVEVANRIEVSQATISRIENGRSTPRAMEVRALAGIYGLDEETLARLLELTSEARRATWSSDFGGLLPNDSPLRRYVAVEGAAGSIYCYSQGWIPHLLQIEPYTRSLYKALFPDWADHEVENMVDLGRRRRQAIYEREGRTEMHAIIDESALVRPCGGGQIMVEQLRMLLELHEQPHIRLDVLPFSIGVHRLLSGDSSALVFEEVDSSSIFFSETFKSEPIDLGSRVAERFLSVFRGVQEQTLKGEAADRRIQTAIRTLETDKSL